MRAPQHGIVEDFDSHAGHGHIRGSDGRILYFHGVQIIDGSRAISPGTSVRFQVVAGHRGRWEAALVEPMPPAGQASKSVATHDAATVEAGFACPVCDRQVDGDAGTYEICPNCGWEDDPVQRDDPSYGGGANHEPLAVARNRWIGGDGAAGSATTRPT